MLHRNYCETHSVTLNVSSNLSDLFPEYSESFRYIFGDIHIYIIPSGCVALQSEENIILCR
jgi:hypothetical protein